MTAEIVTRRRMWETSDLPSRMEALRRKLIFELGRLQQGDEFVPRASLLARSGGPQLTGDYVLHALIREGIVEVDSSWAAYRLSPKGKDLSRRARRARILRSPRALFRRPRMMRAFAG